MDFKAIENAIFVNLDYFQTYLNQFKNISLSLKSNCGST